MCLQFLHCPLADGRVVSWNRPSEVLSARLIIIIRHYNPTVETVSLNVTRIRRSVSPYASVFVRHFTVCSWYSVEWRIQVEESGRPTHNAEVRFNAALSRKMIEVWYIVSAWRIGRTKWSSWRNSRRHLCCLLTYRPACVTIAAVALFSRPHCLFILSPSLLWFVREIRNNKNTYILYIRLDIGEGRWMWTFVL
jgi:hypothetical protein